MGPSCSGWVQMDPDESRWIQMDRDWSELKQMSIINQMDLMCADGSILVILGSDGS